ncbi:MAG: hypothetical protein EOO06_20175 [Chitinophagaceae bacterium]|nr:MAG: hypothetical protein EOO06_20175 [Chitinophagaceae bacterium]
MAKQYPGFTMPVAFIVVNFVSSKTTTMSTVNTNKRNRTQGAGCGLFSRLTKAGIAVTAFFLMATKNSHKVNP